MERVDVHRLLHLRLSQALDGLGDFDCVRHVLNVVDPDLSIRAAHWRGRVHHLPQVLAGCLVRYLLVHTAALREFLGRASVSVLSSLTLSLARVVLLEDHLSLAISGIKLLGFLLNVVELVDRVSYLSLLCFQVLKLLDVWAVVRLVALLELWTQHGLHLVAVP